MNTNVTRFPMQPRSVRPAPELLGLYLRAGRNDHKVLLNLLASGSAACFGVVFDPTQIARHEELKEQVLLHRLDAILDTKAMQLALPGGHTSTLGKLPWGEAERIHTPEDFRGLAGRRLIGAIGDFAVKNGYTEVLAPTHLLRSWNDPWVSIDVESTRLLREYLDQNGGRSIPLIYPLALPYSVFRNPELRAHVIDALVDVRADAIWLKVDGFGGARATATGARNFIAAAADFHQLGRKLVADCVGGTVALALVAFRAVGGIAHGVTLLEDFNSASLRSTKKNKAFAAQRRVYVPSIDAMLSSKEAEQLLEASPQAKAAFGCRDTHCCRRGIKDMLVDPGRHYLQQRMKEVSEISQFPEPIRPQLYMDRYLRPATDRAVQAASLSLDDEALTKKLQGNRKRLDSLRVALGTQLQKSPPQTFAVAPQTRAMRERSNRG